VERLPWLGECSVLGEAITLNKWLVRKGWALNFEPYAKRRFVGDEADARANRRGLWRGCFAAPQDLRRWDKRKAQLLGVTCPSGDDTTVRNGLFPDHPSMPPGCPIKGTYALRAKITGHRGIYHMEGCRSYRSTTNPKRWFCSEEEAKAAAGGVPMDYVYAHMWFNLAAAQPPYIIPEFVKARDRIAARYPGTNCRGSAACARVEAELNTLHCARCDPAARASILRSRSGDRCLRGRRQADDVLGCGLVGRAQQGEPAPQ